MAAHRSAVYFVVAGLNSFSTVLFFYYFYFFAREAFGFDDAQNLWLAALQGGVYAIGSWMGGTLVLVLAQIGFGLALGLIYSSSLFYSMDAGPARGHHGGIHEAAIGLGNMSGPLIGALAWEWVPQLPQGGTIAITCLLVAGGWILWRMRPQKPDSSLPGNERPPDRY